MSHIILLGDSIFDNGAYVHGGPDVNTQLQEILPVGWKTTLRAVSYTHLDVYKRQQQGGRFGSAGAG